MVIHLHETLLNLMRTMFQSSEGVSANVCTTPSDGGESICAEGVSANVCTTPSDGGESICARPYGAKPCFMWHSHPRAPIP